MEKFANNKSGGHNAKYNGANNFLPPVKQKNRIFFANVLVVGIIKKSNRDLGAPFISLSLVVGQVITVICVEKTQRGHRFTSR